MDLEITYALYSTETTTPPATDTPATDAPATDAPATEAPATDAPADDNQGGTSTAPTFEDSFISNKQNADYIIPATVWQGNKKLLVTLKSVGTAENFSNGAIGFTDANGTWTQTEWDFKGTETEIVFELDLSQVQEGADIMIKHFWWEECMDVEVSYALYNTDVIVPPSTDAPDTPVDDNPTGNAPTGVGLATIPATLAGAALVATAVVHKKKQ